MKSLAISVLFALAANAQQSAYGQCGGIGWSGATSCSNGWSCQVLNDWYSQCLPGSSPAQSSAPVTTSSSPTTLTTSVVQTKTSTAAVSTGTGFAKTSGYLFNIDGKTQYFAGTNCYWCGFLTNNGDIDHVFADMQSSGYKVVRVWGFNDVNSIPGSGTVWFQYLSSSGSQINTGANGLQRLDYLVQSAQAHGLKLVINFVNNWSDYGGFAAYNKAFGGSTSSWYTDSRSQSQYQTYIKAVVSRYVNSPAIFAWELANEPRCSGCDSSVIYNWASTTSKYIKSLDPNHMVTMGDEGFGPETGSDGSFPFTQGAGGYSFAQNLGISTLDYGTLHLYPQSWGTSSSWGNLWITTHAAACVAAGKPCVLEEYGYTDTCSVESQWQATSLSTNGMGGDMIWQYGDVLPSNGQQTAQDGNTVYFTDKTNWQCFVTNHVNAIKAKYP